MELVDLHVLQCCAESNSKVARLLRALPGAERGLECAVSRRIVHSDISCGRESHAVSVVNEVDESNLPSEFLYVNGYVETMLIPVNRIITSLSVCHANSS